MQVLQQPEAYIANSFDLFDEDGKMNNQDTLKYLQVVVDAFVALVNHNK